MRIYQSWSTKAAEVVAPGPREKKKKKKDGGGSEPERAAHAITSQCPSSAPYWQSRALLPLAKEVYRVQLQYLKAGRKRMDLKLRDKKEKKIR